MKKFVKLGSVAFAALAAVASAGTPGSFEQAKELSARLEKPVLMEFVHED